jgi:hypothetical protein
MHFNTLKTLSFVTGLSTTLLISGFTSSAFAMSPFQANYQFSYNGKNMGSATRTLTKQGNAWNYVFAAKAGVIASATETSNFALKGNNIESNNFSRNSKILVHNNTLNIKFNPSTKTITTAKDKENRNFAWQAGVLDELNAELQIREDIKAGGLKSRYLIADAKEVEVRQFVRSGNEKVQTNYGTFDTIKVIMKHDKPGRETIFWLAPKLDYLPVKVSHEDKKSSYGLLLTGYKGASK